METGLQVRNSVFNGKRGEQAKRPGSTEGTDAVLAGGCRAEQTPQHGFILVLSPLQCLALPWWAMKPGSIPIPPSPDSEILVDVGKGARAQCRSEQCLLLFAMDLKENISHMSLQSLSQDRTEGFCHPSGFGLCCPTLPAVHTCVVFAGTWRPQPGTQQPMQPWPLLFYCLTHPRALRSSLKPAISPTFLITVVSVAQFPLRPVLVEDWKAAGAEAAPYGSYL